MCGLCQPSNVPRRFPTLPTRSLLKSELLRWRGPFRTDTRSKSAISKLFLNRLPRRWCPGRRNPYARQRRRIIPGLFRVATTFVRTSMALANTSRAIGAISRTLRERLTAALGTAVDLVTVGRPEPASSLPNHSRLNLFLYEVHIDEFLRNESLDEGQPPPLWLALHYLLTAFDAGGESDTELSHEILGAGMRALQAINFLQPTAGATAPLQDNPNELKVTFDHETADLLSKLMQGPDMKYRCSAAFQVRPVLIAPADPPSYSQLVGIDYTAG